jgi:hypothetical protein
VTRRNLGCMVASNLVRGRRLEGRGYRGPHDRVATPGRVRARRCDDRRRDRSQWMGINVEGRARPFAAPRPSDLPFAASARLDQRIGSDPDRGALKVVERCRIRLVQRFGTRPKRRASLRACAERPGSIQGAHVRVNGGASRDRDPSSRRTQEPCPDLPGQRRPTTLHPRGYARGCAGGLIPRTPIATWMSFQHSFFSAGLRRR